MWFCLCFKVSEVYLKKINWIAAILAIFPSVLWAYDFKWIQLGQHFSRRVIFINVTTTTSKTPRLLERLSIVFTPKWGGCFVRWSLLQLWSMWHMLISPHLQTTEVKSWQLCFCLSRAHWIQFFHPAMVKMETTLDMIAFLRISDWLTLSTVWVALI